MLPGVRICFLSAPTYGISHILSCEKYIFNHTFGKGETTIMAFANPVCRVPEETRREQVVAVTLAAKRQCAIICY